MIKKHSLLLLLTLIAVTAFAQLPNQGNVILWLDASEGAHQSDAGTVTWIDKALGNSFYVDGEIVSNEMNGKPVVRFSGGNGVAYEAGLPNGPSTIFVVFKREAASTSTDASSNWSRLISVWDGHTSGDMNYPSFNKFLFEGDREERPYLYMLTEEEAARFRFSFGMAADKSNFNLRGDIAEIIVYKSTFENVDQMLEIQNYLSDKWGMPRNYAPGWLYTGHFPEAVERKTHNYPLSDQFNEGDWEPLEDWTDEFDDGVFNTDKWSPFNPTWQGRAPSFFMKENISEGDGNLKLSLELDETVPMGYFNTTGWVQGYGAACTFSNNEYRYGYFEVRSKTAVASSAFWFVNEVIDQQNGNEAEHTEIDVYEIGGYQPGYQDKYNTNAHVFKLDGEPVERYDFAGDMHSGIRFADDYHVYGLYWDADFLKWYVDGNLVRVMPNSYFDKPLFMLFDTETMPEWFGIPPDHQLPGTHSIDYVRSWKNKTTVDNWSGRYNTPGPFRPTTSSNHIVQLYNTMPDHIDENTQGPATDRVYSSLETVKMDVASQTSYSFNVAYSATTNRDVVVEFYEGSTLLGQGSTSVSAGTGTTTVNVTLSSAPATFSGYKAVISLRPTGAQFSQSLDYYYSRVSVGSVIDINGISLPPSASVTLGNTTSLVATFDPSNATNKNVTWKSENEDIATIDASGVVTGIAVGNVTITAHAEGGNVASTILTVNGNSPVSGVTISKSSLTIPLNEIAGLTAQVQPETASNKNISWSSNNSSVASVDQNGIITANGIGTAIITVTSESGSQSASCNVTVTDALPAISITSEITTIGLNQRLALQAILRPNNGQAITWSSSNSDIISVDGTGAVWGESAGEATITASITGASATIDLEVTDRPKEVYGVYISLEEKEMQLGNTFQLHANTKPENADNNSIIWSSNFSGIASVDQNGLVTANGIGTTQIIATSDDGGHTAVCSITVGSNIPPVPVESVVIDPRPQAIFVDETLQFYETVSPEAADNKEVVWSTSDPIIGTIDQNGLFTGVGVGCVDVIATTVDGNLTATCRIEVKDNYFPEENMISCELVPREVLVQTNYAIDVKYEVTQAYDISVEIKTMADEWLGNNQVTVEPGRGIETIPVRCFNGLSGGLGTSMVSVGDNIMFIITLRPIGGDWTTSIDICRVENISVVSSITNVPVTDVSLNQSTGSVEVSRRLYLNGTIAPENATNKNITWSSNNPSVARVDENGMITGISIGNAVITATSEDGSHSATCNVSVTPFVPISVTGVELLPSSATISVNGGTPLKYIIEPSKATDKTVSWQSSDETVATVSDDGYVTPTGLGEAEITVITTDGSFSDACIITVQDENLATSIEYDDASKYASSAYLVGNTMDITTYFEAGTGKTLAASGIKYMFRLMKPDWSESLQDIVVMDNSVAGMKSGISNVSIPLDGLTPSDELTGGNFYFLFAEMNLSDGTVINLDGIHPINITDDLVSVTGVSLNSASLTMRTTDDDVTLTATVEPANATNKNVSWSSSNTSVATVTNGIVSAVGEGGATITVTTEEGGFTSNCNITVDNDIVVLVSDISITPSPVFITPGGTKTLVAEVFPANADNQNVTWSSSNGSVVSVNSSGLATAQAASGSATITATAADGSGVSETVEVTISTIPSDPGLYIDDASIYTSTNYEVGSTIEVNLTYNAGAGQTVTDQYNGVQVMLRELSSWTAPPVNDYVFSNATVIGSESGTVTVSVDLTGIPTTAEVEAEGNFYFLFPRFNSTDGNDYHVNGLNPINIVPAGGGTPVESVSVNPGSETILVGSTVDLNETVLPVDATNKSVTWSSSNNSIATVNSTGLVTGAGVGSATITVSTVDGGFTANSTITVDPVLVTGVTVEPTTITVLDESPAQTITATIEPGNATDKSVSWSSSNEAVATVVDGIVTIEGVGTAVITVTTNDGDHTANTSVTVQPIPVTGVELNHNQATIAPGTTAEFLAIITPDNATNQSVSWSSSNESVATVIDGTVTGVANGAATITVTTNDGGFTANATVTVDDDIVNVTGVSITSTTTTIQVGDTVHLHEVIAPADADNKNVSWSNENDHIVSLDIVNNVAVITGESLGESDITVKTQDGNHTSTVTITVERTPVTGVTLNPDNETIDIGESISLIESVIPESATNRLVSWSTDDENVATVTDGLVTGIGEGTVIITVKTDDGGHTAKAIITVSDPTVNVTDIVLNTNAEDLVLNETILLQATVKPENATDKSITWSSSNTDIATVNDTGLVTGVGKGQATITATSNDGEIEALATINVIVPVTGISISASTDIIKVGESLDLTAIIVPENANNTEVTWRSSEVLIASVDFNGVVTAYKPGVVEIVALTEEGNISASFTITIEKNSSIEQTGLTNLKVYPNPAVNTITISGIASETYKLSVLNTQGASLITNEVHMSDNEIVDISSLPVGLYILRITNQYQTESIVFNKID